MNNNKTNTLGPNPPDTQPK